jgi:hypothetical protein
MFVVRHWMGRPGPEARREGLLRLTASGRWAKDDGVSLGLSFSGTEGLAELPTAWGPDCRCKHDRPDDPDCPLRKALARTILRYQCANERVMEPPLSRKP